jgi:hypothetical protein
MRLAPLPSTDDGAPRPAGLARVVATAVIFAVLADLTLTLLVAFASTLLLPGLFIPPDGQAASLSQLLAQLAAGLVLNAAGGWVAAVFAREDPIPSALAAAGLIVAIGVATLPSPPPPLWFQLLGYALTFPAYAAGAALVRRSRVAAP